MESFLFYGAFLAICAVAVFFAGRDGGLNSAKRSEAEADVDAAKRIAKARSESPDTRNDLVDRLRNGGGL
jgi:hypothetical protein